MKKYLVGTLALVLLTAALGTGVARADLPQACTGTSFAGQPVPSVQVQSPNGGETYTAGQQITVSWQSCNLLTADTADIVISSDQTTVQYRQSVENSGSETITLPSTADLATLGWAPGLHFKVTVTVDGVSDTSDALFAITTAACDKNTPPSATIIAPNGGEVFGDQQLVTIKWTTCNIPVDAPIALNLTSDLNHTFGFGLRSATTNSNVFKNTGSDVVYLPAIASFSQYGWQFGKSYRVNIQDYNNRSVFDQSDKVFTIGKSKKKLCTIDSFAADPVSVASGDAAMLSWATSGCSTITINGSSYSDMTGSATTGPLVATVQNAKKTFVLYTNLPPGCIDKTGYSSINGRPCSGDGDPNIQTKSLDVAVTFAGDDLDHILFLGGSEDGFDAFNDVYLSSDMENWGIISANDASDTTKWSPRTSPGVAYFNKKYWVIGGDGKSDVWKSSDGISWTLVTATTPFAGYIGTAVTSFAGKLYVIAGDNVDGTWTAAKIWSSTNGKTWTAATLPFKERAWPGVGVFNGTLYIIGGRQLSSATSKPVADIWTSTDGTTFTRQTASAPWGNLYEEKLLPLRGAFYLIGGAHWINDTTEHVAKNVWKSTDGISWVKLDTTIPMYSLGYAEDAVVSNGKMWISDSNDQGSNKLWSSTDGVTWKLQQTLPWIRSFYRFVAPKGGSNASDGTDDSA
jgi:hypothetical protein